MNEDNLDHLPDWKEPSEFEHFGVMIPDHLVGGLRRYAVKRELPGHFLTKVLENDLSGACGRADPVSASALPVLVAWMYNHLPSSAWGGPKKVREWVKGGE